MFQDIQLSHAPERGIIFTNQTLVLQQINQSQAGRYMCESANQVGKGRSEDIKLDVKCKCCRRNESYLAGAVRNKSFKSFKFDFSSLLPSFLLGDFLQEG